jgi:hypothetical protein
VKDLDGEVLALLTEDLLVLLLENPARPVMGVDDRVADLEVDALDFALDFEVLQKLLFSDVGDGVLLGAARLRSQVCR